MKNILYFTAVNTTGSSASIVSKLKEKLQIPIEYRNVIDKPDAKEANAYDHVIYLIATYGDQELQDDFESFLLSQDINWTGKKFSICELGNYYGYDDFATGAGDVVEGRLKKKKAVKHIVTTSIDTLPLIDWHEVDQWINRLNALK